MHKIFMWSCGCIARVGRGNRVVAFVRCATHGGPAREASNISLKELASKLGLSLEPGTLKGRTFGQSYVVIRSGEVGMSPAEWLGCFPQKQENGLA